MINISPGYLTATVASLGGAIWLSKSCQAKDGRARAPGESVL